MQLVNSKANRSIKIALLASISFIMMFIGFRLPVFPSFLKVDFSELPVLVAAIFISPTSGILTSLIKNILHLAVSQSMGIGELINFIMSTIFIMFFYISYKKYKKIFLSLILSAILTAFAAVPVNYYIMFPLYKYILNIYPENILKLASVTNLSVKNLSLYFAFVIFPFNVIKFSLTCFIMYLAYPVLHKAFKAI